MAQTSVDFLRLRWLVQEGPLSERIHVVEDAEDANSAQTPFQDTSGAFHPVSKMALTRPPTSECIVRIDDMDGYKNWSDSEDDTDEEVHDPVNPNPPEALEDGWKGPYLKLNAKDHGFITIGDYAQAVHPWLVGLRPRYLREHGFISGHSHYKPDIDLWFDVKFTTDIMLINPQDDNLEQEWAGFAKTAKASNNPEAVPAHMAANNEDSGSDGDDDDEE